jgi:hypothetical protein
MPAKAKAAAAKTAPKAAAKSLVQERKEEIPRSTNGDTGTQRRDIQWFPAGQRDLAGRLYRRAARSRGAVFRQAITLGADEGAGPVI